MVAVPVSLNYHYTPYLINMVVTLKLIHGVLKGSQETSFNVEDPFWFVFCRAELFNATILEAESQGVPFQGTSEFNGAFHGFAVPWITIACFKVDSQHLFLK